MLTVSSAEHCRRLPAMVLITRESSTALRWQGPYWNSTWSLHHNCTNLLCRDCTLRSSRCYHCCRELEHCIWPVSRIRRNAPDSILRQCKLISNSLRRTMDLRRHRSYDPAILSRVTLLPRRTRTNRQSDQEYKTTSRCEFRYRWIHRFHQDRSGDAG